MATGSSSDTSVYRILVFSFAGQHTAGEIVQRIKASHQLGGFKILAEAVAECDASGKLHIHEPGRGGVGGTVGAVAGGLVGLFVGPAAILWLAVIGGVLGGVAGHFAGRAIPPEDLKQIAAALPPNSSGFLVLVEDTEVEAVANTLTGYHATVVTITVGSELSGVIETAVVAGVAASGAMAQGADASAKGSETKGAEMKGAEASAGAAAGPGTTSSAQTAQQGGPST